MFNALMTINGCPYTVDINSCNVLKRAVVIVCQLDEEMVGMIEIDHNTESTNVQYKTGQGEYTDGMYKYSELPDPQRYEELATWIVNTHPFY